MTLTDRLYRATDRDTCIALFGSNVPRFFHASEFQAFTAFLDSAVSAYFVVHAGEVVVGCGGFTLVEAGRVANLCWGMVRRDHHGQGVGHHLLRARLHAIATTTTATHVRLATSQHTAGFYRRYGFEVQSVQPDGIASGLDEVEMRLDLVATSPEPARE